MPAPRSQLLDRYVLDLNELPIMTTPSLCRFVLICLTVTLIQSIVAAEQQTTGKNVTRGKPYRLQAWHCWRIGATGSFFWAFADNGGMSSWNEYASKRSAFTPLLLDHDSVTAAKQMEAIRESVEDYDYLVMLRSAIEQAAERGLPSDRLQSARDLLDSAVNSVLTAPGCDEILWHALKDRSRADNVRVTILKQLTDLEYSQARTSQ